MCHTTWDVSATWQCSLAGFLKGVLEKSKRDRLARQKDTVGGLRSGEEKRCSPDSVAVWASATLD